MFRSRWNSNRVAIHLISVEVTILFRHLIKGKTDPLINHQNQKGLTFHLLDLGTTPKGGWFSKQNIAWAPNWVWQKHKKVITNWCK